MNSVFKNPLSYLCRGLFHYRQWEYRVEGRAKIQNSPLNKPTFAIKDLDALYWATKYHEYSLLRYIFGKRQQWKGHAEAITEYIVGFRGIDAK